MIHSQSVNHGKWRVWGYDGGKQLTGRKRISSLTPADLIFILIHAADVQRRDGFKVLPRR